MLETESLGALIFRLVLTLAFVIAIILGTVWVLRRLMAKRWPGKLKDRPIRVLDRIQLAPKRSLDVVAVGDRIIVLGVTENGINLLTELSPEEKHKFQPATAGQHGFHEALSEAKDRMQQVFSRARTVTLEASSKTAS
jgi:flagellar biosynthetic protein FliO